MTYSSDSSLHVKGINLYYEAVNDIDSGLDGIARSKLQQAQQIFQQCERTDAEAKNWLAMTNQLLLKI